MPKREDSRGGVEDDVTAGGGIRVGVGVARLQRDHILGDESGRTRGDAATATTTCLKSKGIVAELGYGPAHGFREVARAPWV